VHPFAGLLVACLGLVANPTLSIAQDATGSVAAPVLSDEQLLRKYVWSTVGAPGAIGAAIVGGVGQWQHYPPEWGDGLSGYSKRWASAYAAAAIGNTTKYAVAHFMHQDPSFARCECAGVGPRLRHALSSPFKARTRDGRHVFSFATVAGHAAEHVVPASAWYPPGRIIRDGVIRGVAGVVTKMGVNVAREFVSVPRLPKVP
jgi:hypothetical protein